MIRINLLPWRAQLKAERQRRYQSLLALAAVITLVVVVAAALVYQSLIDRERAHHDQVRGQIDRLGGALEQVEALQRQQQQLALRKTFIEQIERERAAVARLFEQMALAVPGGVQLAVLQQQGGVMTVRGTAQSSKQITELLARLEATEGLVEPDLRVVEADADESYRFRIELDVAP